jgi:phosphotransferase system enzyme I (PtsI)
MRRLKGIGVSAGVVAGRAVVLIQRAQALRYQIAPARVADELARLDDSRSRARAQLVDIQSRLARRRPELSSLFDAQLLMLDDPMLLPRAATIVQEQRVNAEWAVQQVFHEFSAVFDEVADPYLRERQGDVADLVGRLRMNLRKHAATPRDLLRELDESSVLVADELTPSVAAQVDWTKVRAFATDAGSRTYHTAILARSLDVPAIVGLHNASAQVQAGQLVVIDGTASELIIDPTPEELSRAAHHADDHRPAMLEAERRRPASTADGVRIRLDANIEFPDDLAAARYAGAEGIGLYRSEFLVTGDADAFRDEERQYEIYRRMLEGMAPGEVTVRTFDVDEEQLASRLAAAPLRAPGWEPKEARASRQGLRGLRLSLTRPDLFRIQLRALLRAARHGQLRIMFPFVSSVEQLREARQMVAQVGADVWRREEMPRVPVGVMIEIPAAAYTADLLAREVDFFTIGTNDLIQYCLAVDRADERVSRLYEPLHPAILRMILMVRRAAQRQRIPVSLCGEMASDPALLTLLVGLGLTEFSMTPGAIPVAKQVLSELRSDELRALARRVLKLATVDEIERVLLAALGRLTLIKGVTS